VVVKEPDLGKEKVIEEKEKKMARLY